MIGQTYASVEMWIYVTGQVHGLLEDDVFPDDDVRVSWQLMMQIRV